MKRSATIILFLALALTCQSQKLTIAPNAGISFGSLSYLPKQQNSTFEIIMPVKQFVPTLGVKLSYQEKTLTHQIAVQYVSAGIGFSIRTYNTITKQNANRIGGTSSIDHALASYSIQKKLVNSRFVIGKTSIIPSPTLGIGLGFNRSNFYYKERYNYATYAFSSANGDYAFYEYYPKRERVGFFIMPELSLAFQNKKGKDFLALEIFYYKGLRDMISYDLNYRHGNPFDNINVANSIRVKSRGSLYGVKISFPITLINKMNFLSH